MKKFEIINGKWIKNLDLKGASSFSTIKISSIDVIGSSSSTGYSEIFIGTGGANLSFTYSSTEQTQYKSDLEFLENLLFNQ